jgi:sigma-B regulation protein RsbU (phosphoserine phosphatase)
MNHLSPSPSHRVPTGLSEYHTTVLVVDDQAIIGEAVKRMLADERDVTFHHCTDPTQAIRLANEIQPTVILQDLVMPNVDGLTLVKFFRANLATRDTPLIVLSSKEEPIVKADAFAVGANDYLVKLPDRIELIARIRYHSRGYINLLERNEAYSRLAESQQRMSKELAAAVKYVRSLLPPPEEAEIPIDWRYIPCADVGGDTFGYHWVDNDHLAVYLLDVTGHGLDSALLSVSVMNVLRSRALLNSNPLEPGQVLKALNEAFPMDSYGGKAFTIWYGVYDRPKSLLSWSGGGHPDALLFEGNGGGRTEPVRLASPGPMMGMMPWDEFETTQRTIAAGSRLYVYSDGCQEIMLTDGGIWPFENFLDFMAQSCPTGSPLDRLLQHVRNIHGSDQLDDDFSIIEVRFRKNICASPLAPARGEGLGVRGNSHHPFSISRQPRRASLQSRRSIFRLESPTSLNLPHGRHGHRDKKPLHRRRHRSS